MPRPLFSDRILFRTSLVALGEFRCPPDNPLWSHENHAENNLVAFPRDPVLIAQANRDPVVADANQVMFYNAGQAYNRSRIGRFGDRSEYLALSDPLARDLAATAGHDAFTFTSGPGSARGYLAVRRLYEHIRAQPDADPLRFEECALTIIQCAFADAVASRRHRPAPSTSAVRHAEAVKSLLAASPAASLTLAQIAAAVDLSPFHLSRTFRAATGTPIFRYRDRLRTRAALEPLADGVRDLTTLAHDLGYSSHSHFTDAFRREFGVAPSRYRATARDLPPAAI